MIIMLILISGVLLGYIFRKQLKDKNLSNIINLTLILLVFFIGVSTGKMETNAISTVITSLEFCILTMFVTLIIATVIMNKMKTRKLFKN
ncbi:LysO family transporter [Methanococcus voltae]|uniref:LysO family transporter n=2 Tax=Methanococcus voltae TaxID=2188 RepID=UPI001AE98430|nr:LysO family transporter [Methanococcus voltae]